jgi:myo-inositol-1(or 4)-monophosphatase
MLPMLNTAVKAARRAGVIINRASNDVGHLTIQSKGENDYVTEVDQKAEQAIIQTLLDAYPEHAILAEESGASGHAGSLGEAEYQWIIDPLDGTTNFLHGFPQYSISIALLYRGQLSVAVIYDPVRNDLYTALRGRGAFLNERRIRVSKRDKLQGSLIGTGFPYRDFTHLDAYTAIFKDLVQKTAGLRRPGSAALDLAWLAVGHIDGFFEIGLNPWDIAAGCLLVQEAGGLVSDFSGEEDYLKSGNIIAGNPKVFVQLLQTITPHLTPALRGISSGDNSSLT